jgi:hypothetical protein
MAPLSKKTGSGSGVVKQKFILQMKPVLKEKGGFFFKKRKIR